MNNMNGGLLCSKCRHIVPFSIEKRQRIRNFKGQEYKYWERYGVCAECHNEIYVPGLDDDNEKRFDAIFRQANGIITAKEINDIMEKYDIEKRPLSHLLGFGEHTISRYLEGHIPSKEYSDLLLLLLNDHTVMEKKLEEGRSRITENAYNKVRKKLDHISKMVTCDTKLELVALYITNSEYDITDLSLQKLLYFVKGMALGVFGDEAIFEGECEAWAYGPVFHDIYTKYKIYGNSLIPTIKVNEDYFKRLTIKDRSVIDYVLDNFGRLNGKVLMDITHKESPWNEARMGLEPFESSRNVISDSSIRDYYRCINDKYELSKKEGLAQYLNSFFQE